jgi:predicted nucleotidyltransferase
MKAREGDLIKTKQGVIFDVKGTVHPPNKIIAFPRYIPTPQGTRKSKSATYGKIYNLNERFQYLQKNQPDLIVFDPVFGETLCEVPTNRITHRYQPQQKLAKLQTKKHPTTLESKAFQLTQKLRQKANIPQNAIGISGSIMAGLTTKKSDIDPLVYGVENCRKAYTALQELLKDSDSGFKPYSKGELQELFNFRSKDTQMSFEDFAAVETSKAFQGKFLGTDYFIRFVKDWNETSEQYGDVRYKNSGYAKITATIADTTDSLFTPCTYRLQDVQVVGGPKLEPITEIASFRGRFCEQTANGEAIEAQGKAELVTDTRNSTEHYRLILGNKPSDYMVLMR